MKNSRSNIIAEEPATENISRLEDLMSIQAIDAGVPYYKNLKSLDELLERDEQREKDGFKRKVRLGKIVKPGGKGSRKIIVVPTTTEDKFYHDSRVTEEQDEKEGQGQSGEGQDSGQTTGTADGEEGDVIGESPLSGQEGEGEGYGAGSGPGEDHEIGNTAYELGKIITEKFKLPNLKNKGKKKSFTKYVYDLTDRNKGSGQILDKKKTLMEIIKTNIGLERFDPKKTMEPENLIIGPKDFNYRVLSKEKDVESQAIVFFVRDYSGSMYGRPTELVCSQHVMIYSWLMYQYKEQVETRFILHDTEAKEVKDFYTYYNSNVAGGTQIMSSVAMVNKIVEEENLEKDYNIYIFYGGDGDDWNSDEKKFVEEINKVFTYVSRFGITIVKGGYSSGEGGTEFERFLKKNKFLDEHKDLIHLDVLPEDAEDKRIIEGIRTLVSMQKVPFS